MTKINSISFGSITIDDKTYEYDIKILSSGKVIKRIWPKSDHLICLEEFSEILKEKPKTIIIGIGQSGVAELEPGVKAELEKQNIKVIEARTPQAAKIFNITKDPKAGLFHLTC